jgi:hypothetical protein
MTSEMKPENSGARAAGLSIYRKTQYTREVCDMIAAMATHHHPQEICEALRMQHQMDVSEDSLRATCSKAKISLKMTTAAKSKWAVREKEKDARAPETEAGTDAPAPQIDPSPATCAAVLEVNGVALRADDAAHDDRESSLRRQMESAMPLTEIRIITNVWPDTARALMAAATIAGTVNGIAGHVLDEIVKRGLLPSILEK